MSDIVENLSFDAKCIAGAWFGIMSPGKGEVTLQLNSVRPTDRALAALAELVERRVISVEAFNRYGGLVYRPLIDCRWGFDFLRAVTKNKRLAAKARWPITKLITGGEKEARAVQRIALSARPAPHPHAEETGR